MRRAYEQDLETVQHWQNEEYPAIRKQGKLEWARISWGDEMGVRIRICTRCTEGNESNGFSFEEGSKDLMHFLPGRARINPDEFLNHDVTTNFVGKKFSQAESTYEQSLALFPQKKPSILTRYFRENGTAVRQLEVEFSFAAHRAYAWRNQF